MLDSRTCNLELINSCLQYECEYWKTVSDCRIRVYISLIGMNCENITCSHYEKPIVACDLRHQAS